MQNRYALGRTLFALCLLSLLLAGCTGIPEGVRPVTGFRLDRYLGTWYEIARLDHSFERGLTDVSATYSRRSDGGVDVLNRGYDAAKGQWKEARGRAYFLDGPEVGSLKVSFFGPFYGGYHIFALDPEYRWALAAGYDHDYLWILARERQLSPDVLEDLFGQSPEGRVCHRCVDLPWWYGALMPTALPTLCTNKRRLFRRCCRDCTNSSR